MVTEAHKAFVEAGIGIVMTMIMADGQYTEEEFVWFKNAQVRHPLFRDVPAPAFNDMLRRVRARLVSEPWRALVEEWAQAVPAEFREKIFELATELAVVDRDLKGREPEVVRYLGRALQIPEEVSRRIFMNQIDKM